MTDLLDKESLSTFSKIIALSYRQGFLDAQTSMLRLSDELSDQREVKTKEWTTKMVDELGLDK